MHKKLGRKINVLDLGCGGGRAAFDIASGLGGNVAVTGISLVPTEKDTKRIKFHIGHFLQLERKFEPNKFDFIYSHFGLWHEKYLDIAMAGVRKIMKPGGRIIFNTKRPKKIWKGFRVLRHIIKKKGKGVREHILYLEKVK